MPYWASKKKTLPLNPVWENILFPNFKLTVAFKGAVCQCMPTLRSASLNHKEDIEVVVDLQIIVRLCPTEQGHRHSLP